MSTGLRVKTLQLQGLVVKDRDAHIDFGFPCPDKRVLENSGGCGLEGEMLSANSGLGAWALVGRAGEKPSTARDS